MRRGRNALDRLLSSDLLRAALLLGLVSCLIHGLFYAPALISDDWDLGLEQIVRGNAAWFDPGRLRPVISAPFLLQHRLLGANPDARYLILAALDAVMALLVCSVVLRSAGRGSRNYALATALLFLVFPTNYTHTWLVACVYDLACIFMLLYAWLLAGYASSGSVACLLMASAALLTSFGFNEGQLGVASIWPLLLGFLHRGRATLRRLVGLCVPVTVVGSFVVWRILSYQSPHDYSAELVSRDSTVWLSRLVLGYKITLVWGWTSTLRYYVPSLPGTLAAVALIGVVVCLTAWLSGYLPAAASNGAESVPGRTAPSLGARLTVSRPYVVAAFAGLALIGAGYVPVATVFMPTLSRLPSRMNLFATLGGAVFFASMLRAAVALAAPRRGVSAERRLAVLTIPFLLLGVVTQVSVQHRVRVAWHEQCLLWQSLFRAAPVLADDTAVLFVLPGYEDRGAYWSWGTTPLEANWDASAALRLLYDNPTLTADVVFPDIEKFTEPGLTSQGIRNWKTGRITEWGRTVVFVYDRDAPAVRQLERLPPELAARIPGEVRLCTTCVVDGLIPVVPLRRLVG